MIIEFNWFSHEGVQDALSIVYNVINVIRLIIPIILIIMTTLDITKKIINPSEKEGQKKILIRILAAIIIFFIPIFINLFLDITGIKIPNINTDPISDKNNSKSDKEIKKESQNEKELPNLMMTNCPNPLTIYHNSDSITLNTNIDSTYSGDIIWSITDGKKFVNLKAINDKKSAEVIFKNIFNKEKVTIYVTAGGNNYSCDINVDKERLDNLSYTNCPSTATKYFIGDTILLKTDISESYKGDIKWFSDDDSSVKINTINDQRSAKIELLDQPKLGYIIIKTNAGYNNASCLINIKAVRELKITNCPGEDQIYHIGDTIILNSNIPSFYKREPIWQSTETPDAFEIKPISNGRSAEVKIISVPEDGHGFVGLGADSEGTSCMFNIKD